MILFILIPPKRFCNNADSTNLDKVLRSHQGQALIKQEVCRSFLRSKMRKSALLDQTQLIGFQPGCGRFAASLKKATVGQPVTPAGCIGCN
jgi:hypothetical protein